MRPQERLPRRALVPLWSRVDPVVWQDPRHRVPGDVVAEVGERACRRRIEMPIATTVRRGVGVTVHHPDLVNLYGCTVGDETKISAFVEIQK